MIARLFAAYEQDSALLPGDWRRDLPTDEPDRTRHITDFIAGMTDRYAIDQCTRIYGTRPEGLSNV